MLAMDIDASLGVCALPGCRENLALKVMRGGVWFFVLHGGSTTLRWLYVTVREMVMMTLSNQQVQTPTAAMLRHFPSAAVRETTLCRLCNGARKVNGNGTVTLSGSAVLEWV